MPTPPVIDIDHEEPGRAWIEPDYSQIEMRIAAQLAPTAGDRVRIGEDEYTVTSVTGRTVAIDTETEPPHRRDPHYTPGGAALRYEASTRIRLPARPRRNHDHDEFIRRFGMTRLPQPSGSTNPCGEIDLGGGPMDQHMTGQCTLHMTVMKTKIDAEAIAEAFAAARPRGPYRSVWWWLKNPIV